MEKDQISRYEELSKRKKPEVLEERRESLDRISGDLEGAKKNLASLTKGVEDCRLALQQLVILFDEQYRSTRGLKPEERKEVEEREYTEAEEAIAHRLHELADMVSFSRERVSELESEYKDAEKEASELSEEENQELANLESLKALHDILEEVPRIPDSPLRDYDTKIREFEAETEQLRNGTAGRHGLGSESLDVDRYLKWLHGEHGELFAQDRPKLISLIASVRAGGKRVAGMSKEHQGQLLTELEQINSSLQKRLGEIEELYKQTGAWAARPNNRARIATANRARDEADRVERQRQREADERRRRGYP